MIFRYSPTHKFTRVYFEAPSLDILRTWNKDSIWAEIKRTQFSWMSGDDLGYWDDKEDEIAERNGWFLDWHNDACWDECGTIAIDAHY